MKIEKFKLKGNVEYIVRDSNGKIKKLFQPWNWVNYLIKKGVISPHFKKTPFIFGYWAPSMKVSNLVVNVGVATLPALVGGTGTVYGAFKYIAVGTATGSPAASSTSLGAECFDSGLTRGTSTNTAVTTDVANDTLQLVLSYSVTGTKAITESAIFNHAGTPVGTMLAFQVFAAINVISGDTLQITWKIDFD